MMKKSNIALIALLLLMKISISVDAQNKTSTKWFTDDRFGMFIHFGLYTVPAGEWNGEVMNRNWYAEWIKTQYNWPEGTGIPDKAYNKLMKEFNPTEFDAEDWILQAKNAGMKYFLITSKHHDGFALWPTKVDDFNIMHTPFKRDILKELSDACKKHGIKFGFYYSHWQDWNHSGGAKPSWPQFESQQPSEKEFDEYWKNKCLPQVRELCENYDPKFFWFDTWGEIQKQPYITEEKIDELIALVKGINPAILLNSRIGSTWRHSKGNDVVDYISMDDNSFPKQKIEKPWETSGTMNHSWGYHKYDFNWKPVNELLRNLIDNVSRNGNYQLNIGPMADGKFPVPSVKRLKEVGAWFTANGEAIYQTRISDVEEPAWGRITEKTVDGKEYMYLFVYDPGNYSDIVVPRMRKNIKQVTVLETSEKLVARPMHRGLYVELPRNRDNEDIMVLKVEF